MYLIQNFVHEKNHAFIPFLLLVTDDDCFILWSDSGKIQDTCFENPFGDRNTDWPYSIFWE